MSYLQNTMQQKEQPRMVDAITVLEGWVKQRELPVSWQLSQRDRRVHCFLEWLSSFTDCESLVVLDKDHEVVAGWNTEDELLSFLQEPISGWKEEEVEDIVFHGHRFSSSQGEVVLGMASSMHIDKEFLNVLTDMLKTVID